MAKKYISANLYHKYLVLYGKILSVVLYNMSLTVLLTWQHTEHTGFQTFPIFKVFLYTILTFANGALPIHDPATPQIC